MLILLSLWTFDIKDPTLNQSVSGGALIRNAAGLFGAYLSGFLTDIFGFASYLWALFFIAMGAGLVSTWFVLPWYRWIGYLLLAACLITVAEAWNLGIRDVRGAGLVFRPAGGHGTVVQNLVAGAHRSGSERHRP